MVQIGRQRTYSNATSEAASQPPRRVSIGRQRTYSQSASEAPAVPEHYGSMPPVSGQYGSMPPTVPEEFVDLIPLDAPPPQRDDVITMWEAFYGKGWHAGNGSWVRATPTALQNPGTAMKRPRRMMMGAQRAIAEPEIALTGQAEFEGGDPQHRFGQWTDQFWKLFTNRHAGRKFPDHAAEFFEWLNRQLELEPPDAEVQRILNTFEGSGVSGIPTSKGLTGAERYRAGVRYMMTEQRRKKYRIHFRGGLLWRQNGSSDPTIAPFDTRSHSTMASGRGWAIWVRDRFSNFYTNSHKCGRFHHSSFLAGAPVQGAGEWIVEQGRIKAVRGKSGHYMPGLQSLVNSLKILRSSGATFDSDSYVVLVTRRGLAPVNVPMTDVLQASVFELNYDYVVDKNSTEACLYSKSPAAPAHPPVALGNSMAPPASAGELFDAFPGRREALTPQSAQELFAAFPGHRPPPHSHPYSQDAKDSSATPGYD